MKPASQIKGQKMNYVRLAVLLATILFSSEKLFAGVSVEPFVGYATGEWSQAGNSAKQSGVDYGARLGWDFGRVRVGGNFLSGALKDNASPISNTITPQDFGAYITGEFGRVSLRAAYNFSSQRTFAPSSGTNNTWKGTSFSAGFDVMLMSHLCLNLDYVAGTYDSLNGASQTSKLTNSFFNIGISFPFGFGGK